MNVVSLRIGHLVDLSNSTAIKTTQAPVHCGKCSAAMTNFSPLQTKQDTMVCVCEFCGRQIQSGGVSPVPGGRGGALRGGDVIHLPPQRDDDYQNLTDSLVVFCVDVSGSMSVTSEVTPGNSMRSPTYVSRLQSMEDALQRALSSLLRTCPHRRVALVTFNDEVVVYGDGSGLPVTLRDWALLDYDHIWQQGVQYSTPHCIAETFQNLSMRVKELREHGATALGPAALVSVAMASRYEGSKVILCTDGRANIGLGELEQSSSSSCPTTPYFYTELAQQAASTGVIISVMTFEGTDCRLAEVGRLADQTGGRVNIVNIGTVATEIQSALADNVLATGVTVTLLAADGVYFPYEEGGNHGDHVLVREIGNVTEGLEVTFQFAVKPESVEGFMKRDRLPFQLQVSFKTRELERVIRIITEHRRVTTSSWVWPGSLNMGVLGVHCAQLCGRLTMEGRVQEARGQLQAQQELLTGISEQRVILEEENIYGNWISTMTTICDDLTTTDAEVKRRSKDIKVSQSAPVTGLSDEAAKVVYQMKRASSVGRQAGREPADMLAL